MDLWKLNIPADLSFAPAKKAPGKIDANKMVNDIIDGYKNTENKVKSTEQNDDLNLILPEKLT